MRYLLILTLPLAAQQPRVLSPSFIAVNGAAVGAAALDVALTRSCINRGTCYERNPLMRGSAGRMYGVALGSAGVGTLLDYEMEKHGHPQGRIVPWVVIGAHRFGAGHGAEV